MRALNSEEMLLLVSRIRIGDSSGEDQLARIFYRRVLLMASARTRDPEAARDLAQETIIAVLEALRKGALREPDRLSAFVHGTCINIVNNYLRVQSSRPQLTTLPEDLPVVDHRLELADHDRRQILRRELNLLEATDRRILLMTLVEGMKPGEISRALHLSSDAVRQRKSRAIRKITERLSQSSRVLPHTDNGQL